MVVAKTTEGLIPHGHRLTFRIQTDLFSIATVSLHGLVQETFELCDVGNKGFLTKSEVLESVKCLGHNPNEQEIWEMQAKVKNIYYNDNKFFFIIFVLRLI